MRGDASSISNADGGPNQARTDRPGKIDDRRRLRRLQRLLHFLADLDTYRTFDVAER